LLQQTLKGEAKLATLEKQLFLTLSGNGRGGIWVRGDAWDQPGIGNQLRFGLEIDQTYLSTAIEGLNAITERFPVRAG
jgi:hypothetical protein